MSPLMPAGVYMEPIPPVVKDSTAFFFCRPAKHSQAPAASPASPGGRGTGRVLLPPQLPDWSGLPCSRQPLVTGPVRLRASTVGLLEWPENGSSKMPVCQLGLRGRCPPAAPLLSV